jgi:hypothetical protein
MRRMSLSTYVCMQVAIVFAAALSDGCVRDAPTAPKRVMQTEEREIHYIPLHHAIPATFRDHPEGPIVYVCATQPRLICDDRNNPSHCERGEDHYLQYEQCPEVPIK